MSKHHHSGRKNMGAWFIAIGAGLIFLSVYLDHEFPNPTYFGDICIHAMAHFGVGGMVVGILGILTDMKHWTNYFKDRLSEIVIGKEHLQNLTSESLITLQREVLQAYFGEASIGGEDGFLNYYQNHIQDYMGSPFRKDMEGDMSFQFLNGDAEKLLVREKISWTCKANRGQIQECIRWQPDQGEFLEVRNSKIRLLHKSFEEELNVSEAEMAAYREGNGLGFVMPLNNYRELDGLAITLESEYVIYSYRFIAWRMAHPSQGFTLAIRYPQEMQLCTEFYGTGMKMHNVRIDEDGYYRLATREWVLPEEGLTFQFLPKEIMHN